MMTQSDEIVWRYDAEDGGSVWVHANGEWGHEGGALTWAFDEAAQRLAALEQIVSELEKSLENARKERDAALADNAAAGSKALVRARNEGLEKAAQRCIEACPGIALEACPCDACMLARRIRALKEPEEGGQS